MYDESCLTTSCPSGARRNEFGLSSSRGSAAICTSVARSYPCSETFSCTLCGMSNLFRSVWNRSSGRG